MGLFTCFLRQYITRCQRQGLIKYWVESYGGSKIPSLHFTWIPEVENAHSLFCIATVTVQSGKFVVILNRAKLFRQKSFVHIDLLKRNSIYLKVVKKKFLYKVYIWASLCPEEWNVVAGPRIMLGLSLVVVSRQHWQHTHTHSHDTLHTLTYTHIGERFGVSNL